MEITLPVLVFCIAFGLPMDYEIFLLSRITEAHRNGASTTGAVAHGLQRTGGLITAAAAILVTVFLALLVPAIMRLAGEANWWAPAPLRRIHHRLGLTD